MRRVHRDLNRKPAILTAQATLDVIAELIETRNIALIKPRLYQDPYTDAEGKTQSRVRDELNIYYHGKCAYCESDCKAEIEHYRPKSAIKEDLTHPGYYWLCYEWSNLLPSCHDCNTAGGKGTQFPVAGDRLMSLPLLPSGLPDPAAVATSGAHLLAEQAYLLHPELDDPDLYLAAELDPKGEGVRLRGIDAATRRGEVTIQIANLNRIYLKANRLRTLSGFAKGISTVISLFLKGKLELEAVPESLDIVFEQMDENARDEKALHTLVLRQAVRTTGQFSSMVSPLLEVPLRPVVEAAFAQYRQQNPF